MAIDSVTLIADAFKNWYLDGLRYQLDEQSGPFFAQLERNTEDVKTGGNIVMAMYYGRTGGIAMLATDVSDLPTPNGRKVKQASWETKNFAARIQISDKAIEGSKSSDGAFANMLTMTIEAAENDAKVNLSRQVHGDGVGKLATLSGNSSYTSASSTIAFTVDNTAYIFEGMLLDVYASDGSAVAGGSGLEVTAVNDDTNTVTVVVASDISSSVVATCYLTVAKSKDNELTGLGAVLKASGTLYGIDRAAYPFLNSKLIPTVGEISDNVIQSAIDKAELRSGSKINYLQCGMGVGRSYINWLAAKKQFPNTLKLKGGWEAISYSSGAGEIPVVRDKYVGAGIMDGLSLSDFKLYALNDFNWMNADGAMLSRVANKPAWEATLIRYMDIGCQRPGGQFRMSGITEH